MMAEAKEMAQFNSENICVRIEQTLKSQLYDWLASRLVKAYRSVRQRLGRHANKDNLNSSIYKNIPITLDVM